MTTAGIWQLSLTSECSGNDSTGFGLQDAGSRCVKTYLAALTIRFCNAIAAWKTGVENLTGSRSSLYVAVIFLEVFHVMSVLSILLTFFLKILSTFFVKRWVCLIYSC